MAKIENLTTEEKAAILDALFDCERIRVLGAAHYGTRGNEGPVRHAGIEFWKHYSMNDAQKEVARENAERFLDYLIELKDGDHDSFRQKDKDRANKL